MVFFLIFFFHDPQAAEFQSPKSHYLAPWERGGGGMGWGFRLFHNKIHLIPQMLCYILMLPPPLLMAVNLPSIFLSHLLYTLLVLRTP